MAAAQVRRLAQSVRKRAPFGWRRTVLLVVGLALLLYGLTAGWRRGPVAGQPEAADGLANKKAIVASEIHRVSRAPLRVEQPAQQTAAASPQANPPATPTPTATPAGTVVAKPAVTPGGQTTNTVAQAGSPERPLAGPTPPTAAGPRQPQATPAGRSAKSTTLREDELFSVPRLGAEPSPRGAEETPAASPSAGSEPEFPVIGAPDGSEISRAGRRALFGPSQLGAAATEPRVAADVRPSARPRRAQATDNSGKLPTVRRETIAERTWQGTEAPSGGKSRADLASPVPDYPQTDPSKYRDPEYVIPSTAFRARGASR
jgi:hypothetical protein